MTSTFDPAVYAGTPTLNILAFSPPLAHTI